MGEGMAARLLSENIAGHTADSPLLIWNRTKSKSEELTNRFEGKHIKICESAKEVVTGSDIVFSMLSTPEASKAVFDSPSGTLAGVTQGKYIVDCATLAESDMKRMSKAVEEMGGLFLEAPVSGSKGPAHTGQLIFLTAGSQTVHDDPTVQSALTAMGKATHYLGDIGNGTRAKLVVNSLMGTMMAAFSESLVLTQSMGLDGSKMLEIIGQGAIQSPMYALKGPKMLKGDHAPNFPLMHAHKDMKLAVDMAKGAGVSYSVTEKAEEIFREVREDTELNVKEEDFSAVFEGLHKASTSEFSKKRKAEE
eukprot:scaffold3884_cov76-Cyclotella_meneghiniana.AAC.3